MVHMMQHLLQHEQHHRRRGHPFNRRISARVNLIILFFFVLQVVSIYVNGERELTNGRKPMKKMTINLNHFVLQYFASGQVSWELYFFNKTKTLK